MWLRSLSEGRGVTDKGNHRMNFDELPPQIADQTERFFKFWAPLEEVARQRFGNDLMDLLIAWANFGMREFGRTLGNKEEAL